MPAIRLGNIAPLEGQPGITVDNDGADLTPLPSAKVVTTIVVPDVLSLTDQLGQVTTVWNLHSGADPVWVEGEDAFFVEAVSRNFECAISQPSDWETVDAN